MVFSKIGEATLGSIESVGRLAIFGARALRASGSGGVLFGRLVRSIFELGVRCIPVITIISIFTGLVLGLQGHHVLSRFGASEMLGTLVSLSLCRELAPVLAALMIAGQAGTALSAELGIQRSTEQIDALELMGICAEGFLVGTRLFASAFVFPVLTAIFVLVGVFGGWISGCVMIHADSSTYWSAVHQAVHPKDVLECMIKALTFGGITISICAFQGFNAHLLSGVAGARAVSLATVRGVVFSSIAVLAADYIITAIMV
jgi:phospholipid/cholesterol/gamma-HCH transport system permease protein